MTADFFTKKRWIAFLLILSVFSCVVYAGILHRTKKVYLGKNFYFLVCATEHVEADALDIRLYGGAGYPITDKGNTAVAIGVYFKETDGLAVQAGLTAQGEQVALIKQSAEYLYFKSPADKKNASIYAGALKGFYSFIEVLSGEIARLDKGATQQSCKRILQTLSDLVSYHKESYQSVYPAYAQLCKTAKEELNECISDTVFVKDLRYLLCELSVGYLELSKEFSL